MASFLFLAGNFNYRSFYGGVESFALCSSVEGGADILEARFHMFPHLGMGEDVEFACFHRFEDARADNVGIETAQNALRRLRTRGADARIDVALSAVTRLPRPPALMNACAHEAGAKDRHADTKFFELWRPTFAHRHDGIFRRAIRFHARRADKTGHRSRVDDVPTLAVALDQRHERLDAVDDALQIDVDDPIP